MSVRFKKIIKNKTKKLIPNPLLLKKRRGSLKSISFHPEGIFGKGEFFKLNPNVEKLT